MAARGKLFTLRMNAAENALLVKLAKHYAISMADVVRMLVKRDADALKKEGKGT